MTEVLGESPRSTNRQYELGNKLTFLRTSRIGGLLLVGASVYAAYKTGSHPVEAVTAEAFTGFAGAAIAGKAHEFIATDAAEQRHTQAVRSNWAQTRIDNIDKAREMAYARQNIELQISRDEPPRDRFDARIHQQQLANLDTYIEDMQNQAALRYDIRTTMPE